MATEFDSNFTFLLKKEKKAGIVDRFLALLFTGALNQKYLFFKQPCDVCGRLPMTA